MSSNEYLLTCLDNDKGKLITVKLDQSLSIMEYNDYTSNPDSLTNCYCFSFYSIIYISQYCNSFE